MEDTISNNQTITIYTDKSSIQTTRETLLNCPTLLDMIKDNAIKLDMSDVAINLIIDYLRGYHREKILAKYPLEAFRLGLLDRNNKKYVLINIGGKYFYLDRKIENFLPYFKKFFEWNKDMDNDYSNKLIDRSPRIFEKVLSYLSKPLIDLLSSDVIMDLEYYGYDNPKDLIFIKKNPNTKYLNQYILDGKQFSRTHNFSSIYTKTVIGTVNQKEIDDLMEYSYHDVPYGNIIIYFTINSPDDTNAKNFQNIIKQISYDNIEITKRYLLFDAKKLAMFINIKKIYEEYQFSTEKKSLLKIVVKKCLEIKPGNFLVYLLNNIIAHPRGRLNRRFLIEHKCNGDVLVVDANQILKTDNDIMQSVILSSVQQISIKYVELKKNDAVIVHISGLKLLTRDQNSYELVIRDEFMKYAICKEDNIKIYIHFNKPFIGNLHAIYFGRFYEEIIRDEDEDEEEEDPNDEFDENDQSNIYP